MKVNIQSLIDRLNVVVPSLSGADGSFESQCIRIWDDNIQVHNVPVVIETRLPSNLGLRLMVPGAPFLSLLKSINTEEVDISPSKDERHLNVKTHKIVGRFNATILDRTFDKISFEGWSCIEDQKLCRDIIDGLRKCKGNVSKDNSSVLCGVRINHNTIISTNRCRIFRHDLSSDCGIECTIPVGFITALERQIQCEEWNATVFFDAKGGKFGVNIINGNYMVSIITSLVEGEYPDLEQYFPDNKEEESRQIGYIGEIDRSISRHIKLLDGVDVADKEVHVICNGKECTITSKNPMVGEISESLELSTEVSDTVEFLINPTLLQEFFKKCSAFKYFPNKRLVLFELDNTRHLIQTRA